MGSNKMNDYGVRQKKGRAPGYELLHKGVRVPRRCEQNAPRKGGGGDRREE